MGQTIAWYAELRGGGAASFLEAEWRIPPTKVDLLRIFDHHGDDDMDFAEVKDQELVKRGLEIAAAAGHNVLLL